MASGTYEKDGCTMTRKRIRLFTAISDLYDIDEIRETTARIRDNMNHWLEKSKGIDLVEIDIKVTDIDGHGILITGIIKFINTEIPGVDYQPIKDLKEKKDLETKPREHPLKVLDFKPKEKKDETC